MAVLLLNSGTQLLAISPKTSRKTWWQMQVADFWHPLGQKSAGNWWLQAT